MTGEVYTRKEYAPHVEYGTIKMAARSFMRAALDLLRKKILELHREAIRKAISGK